MTTWHHHFRRIGPIVKWHITEQGVQVAHGWALGKNRAWRQSIDWINEQWRASTPGEQLQQRKDP